MRGTTLPPRRCEQAALEHLHSPPRRRCRTQRCVYLPLPPTPPPIYIYNHFYLTSLR
eukprot:COSAG01_NODE_46260_length_401_cov_3.043046_1_plen_56_part_01